jgi:hypothetical protein
MYGKDSNGLEEGDNDENDDENENADQKSNKDFHYTKGMMGTYRAATLVKLGREAVKEFAAAKGMVPPKLSGEDSRNSRPPSLDVSDVMLSDYDTIEVDWCTHFSWCGEVNIQFRGQDKDSPNKDSVPLRTLKKHLNNQKLQIGMCIYSNRTAKGQTHPNSLGKVSPFLLNNAQNAKMRDSDPEFCEWGNVIDSLNKYIDSTMVYVNVNVFMPLCKPLYQHCNLLQAEVNMELGVSSGNSSQTYVHHQERENILDKETYSKIINIMKTKKNEIEERVKTKKDNRQLEEEVED